MTRRPILGNFLSMASLRIGSAAFTFVLFWFLSHRLTTSQLGGFSLLMNAFFIVQGLPLLGMAMPLMRRVAAHPNDAAAETSSALYFALPMALVIGVGLTIAGRWYAAEGLSVPFALVGLSIIPTAWTLVAESVLVGREQMKGIAYVNVLEALGRFIGALGAVLAGFGLTGVFVVFVVLRVAAAIAYLANPHIPTPRWRQVHPRNLHAYRVEFPTFLSIAVVTALCTRSDIFLVSKFLSLKDAGIYAAAARLSDAVLMVPTMAAIAVFPTQARLFLSDRAGFALVLERAVRWCLILGFAVVLVAIALSPHLFNLIYAPSLAPAVPVFQILVLGVTLMVIDQLLSTTMMAAHAQHADLRSMTVGLVVLGTLMFAFIHFYGLLGAAVAPPAALFVRIFYRLYWAQKLFSKPLVFTAMRALVAAACGISVFFVGFGAGSLVDLTLALTAYALALVVTNSVCLADWQNLRRVVMMRYRSWGT